MIGKGSRVGNKLPTLRLVLIVILLAGTTAGAAQPGSPASDMETLLALESKIGELKALATALDDLSAHLTTVAENALDQADMAPGFDERSRYEQLYRETSARIGELQAQQARLEQLLAELESKLERIRRDQ